jgi:hypothetical protein
MANLCEILREIFGDEKYGETDKQMERGFHTFSLFCCVYSSQSRCYLKLFSKYICFFLIKKPEEAILLGTLPYNKSRIIIRCFLWAPVTLHWSGPTHYSIIQGQPINYSSISSTHLQNSALIPSPFSCARCGVLFHFSLIFLRKETLSQQESVVFQITYICSNSKIVNFKCECRKVIREW